MDGLDFDILQRLCQPGGFQWNFRESLGSVARGLGLDEETVRLRVKRMETDGVLHGYDVLVHPDLLGRELVILEATLPVGPARMVALERLKLAEGMLWIFEEVGNGVTMGAMVETGGAAARLSALVESITGERAQANLVPMPPPNIAMTAADWGVVQALRHSARAPFDKIAEAAGMSEMKVRRRVHRMIEAHALLLNAHVDIAKVSGVIPCVVHAELKDPRRRAAVDAYLAAIPHPLFRNVHATSAVLSFAADSPGQLRDLRRWLEGCDEVARSRVDVCTGRIFVDGWLDGQIARRAAPIP